MNSPLHAAVGRLTAGGGGPCYCSGGASPTSTNRHHTYKYQAGSYTVSMLILNSVKNSLVTNANRFEMNLRYNPVGVGTHTVEGFHCRLTLW